MVYIFNYLYANFISAYKLYWSHNIDSNVTINEIIFINPFSRIIKQLICYYSRKTMVIIITYIDFVPRSSKGTMKVKLKVLKVQLAHTYKRIKLPRLWQMI